MVKPFRIPTPSTDILSLLFIFRVQLLTYISHREMIFDIATTISFLSQGTTLERGTIIMTGTGPGIGAMRNPKIDLKPEDDMRVEIEQIGTLINKVYYE